jgi:hypothetical protein
VAWLMDASIVDAAMVRNRSASRDALHQAGILK